MRRIGMIAAIGHLVVVSVAETVNSFEGRYTGWRFGARVHEPSARCEA